jgi:hypothetical protein
MRSVQALGVRCRSFVATERGCRAISTIAALASCPSHVKSLFLSIARRMFLHHCYLLDASGSDGRRAVLVLDGAAAGTAGLDRSDRLVGLDIAIGNAAEDDVLAIEPRSDDGGDEELRTVAVVC